MPVLVRNSCYGTGMSCKFDTFASLHQQRVQMAGCNLSDVLQVLDQLTRDELLEMVSGQLSVPHAHRTKQKLVRFIIDHRSEELLQNLKERAQRRVGKRRERSPGELASRKRVCVVGVR